MGFAEARAFGASLASVQVEEMANRAEDAVDVDETPSLKYHNPKHARTTS